MGISEKLAVQPAAVRLRDRWARAAGRLRLLVDERHHSFPGVLAIFFVTALANVVGATVDYTFHFGRYQSSLTLPSSSYLHSILLNPGNAVFLVVVVCWLLKLAKLARIAMFLATAIITLFICDWVLVLVTTIPSWKGNLGAGLLLLDAVAIWVLNIVVFATWYWLLDGGGAERRGTEREGWRDFSYPQQAENIPLYRAWHAGFNDYLHVAFMVSTSFTAGTVHVLSKRAKNLNMLQAVLSIALVAMAIGRAIATFSTS
ncbi:MAG TPA: hypothetical protein VEL12_14915 [Candidatus Nitrosopolaris sp.]|nr:hypothetical protein [Candidatus Nitrosopolaris sp.]